MSFTLLTFVLAALLTIAMPGPTSLLAFSNGARHGLRDAGFGIAGAVLSDLVLIAAVSAGEVWLSNRCRTASSAASMRSSSVPAPRERGNGATNTPDGSGL